MEQTSKLSIVVDTSRAASQIKAFSTALKQADRDGIAVSKSLAKIGSGVNFSALNSSINNARASLSAFRSTANNATTAMTQAANAAKQLRAATQGIATNFNAVASAAGKISNISGGINKARISSGKLGTVIRDVNKNVLTLNSTLNTVIATLNRYGQAATTAAQRTTAFGQAATQSQTRLRGLDAGLLAARNNMNSLTTAANSINAIFGNLDRTMAQLAAATNRLSDASTRAAAQIQRLDNGLGGANARGRTFMGTLQGLQGLLMGGMFSIATLGIIKTADEMQNLNSQIKLVTKSEEEYLGIRQKVREIADANFSDVKSATSLYATSARSLANLGKSQADVLEFTNAVSLAMRAGGRSAQEQASAILQLSQSMGANVVQGDEFRSIAENAPILLELVAKRLGVLPGQLKALAADGKITGEVMFDALTQNVNILEDMAKKMPVTMAQAFTVAKNRYKSYVDDMMNQTGGMSGKIAKMIEGMSANFDTLAKVAIAGVTLAFANMALSIGSASTAMAIFNAVASMNPLILIASAFIAVNSAIFGVNDVLSISGIMLGDFFDGMLTMLKDGETWWMDFSDTVAVAMGGTVKSVAEANDKNSKNFLGFYTQTEKGFAGVVQGLGSSISSVTAIFGTFFKLIENWVLNTLSIFDNMGKAAYNAGVRVRNFFGGDGETVEYSPYANKSLNPLGIYGATHASNQDYWRDYARGLNQRAGITPTPLDRQWSNKTTRGLNFGNVLTPGANSVLKPKAGQLPDYLKPAFTPSTLPMDVEKLRQKNLMDEMNALKESEKQNKKLQKERDKANKGLSNRLVGISGDTGVGNAHLHIQYRDKSRPVSAADLARFQAGGKAITDYPMTSGFGKRNTGIKGASTNHKGTDFGIPKNTPITTNVAVKGVKTWKDGKGGGYVSTITFEDGVVIDLLHQMPSVMGVDKGASTGNKQIDSMVAKAESNIAREAAKAEKERIRAAEEAQRERERIAALNLKLMKEYGDKEAQLTIENDARVAEINESSFNSTKKAELIKESERRMKQELAVYKKGLDDRVNELVKFQKTERDLLKKQYDDEVFEIVSHPELSRPENSDMLKQAFENAKLANEYRVSLYEESLEQQKSAMYAFQKTERDILIDGWENKLADAMLMYDELRDYRIEAIKAEGRLDIDVFDTNQELKLLELKKATMTEMEYIRAKYELERKLAGLGNEDPTVKAAQDADAKRAFEEAQREVKQRVGGNYDDVIRKIYGLSNEDANLTKSWQEDSKALKAAYDEGLVQYEEYINALEDLDRNYINNKQAIIVGGYQSAFGLAASITKAFGGEQSSMYRALFAVEKAFAFSRIFLENKVALAKAYASAPFPYNLVAVGKTLMTSGVLTAAIDTFTPKGFKQGGYTGNMGASQVAGVVHGQEYVFDAQSTKRIGVDNLNAMRSGKAVGETKVIVNNYSNEKANVQTTPDGDTIVTIGKIAQGVAQSEIHKFEKRLTRQGGPLYGMR